MYYQTAFEGVIPQDHLIDATLEMALRDKLQAARLGTMLNAVKHLEKLNSKLRIHDAKKETVTPNALLRRFAVNGKSIESGKALKKAFDTQLDIFDTFLTEWEALVKGAFTIAHNDSDTRLNFNTLWGKTKDKWVDMGDRTLKETEYSVLSPGVKADKRIVTRVAAAKHKLVTPTTFESDVSFQELYKSFERGLTLVKKYKALEEEGGRAVIALFGAYGGEKNAERRIALDDYYLSLFNPHASMTDVMRINTRAFGEFLLRY